MRNTLIYEAMLDVLVSWCFGRQTVRDFAFLELAFTGISQKVVRELGSHDPGTGQGQCHTACINGDPPTSPLFRNESCCTRTTGRIKYQVSGIR